MKARLEGVIKQMTRETNMVALSLELVGQAELEKTNPDAKIITGEVTLRVKPIIANELKFGDKLYFTLRQSPE